MAKGTISSGFNHPPMQSGTLRESVAFRDDIMRQLVPDVCKMSAFPESMGYRVLFPTQGADFVRNFTCMDLFVPGKKCSVHTRPQQSNSILGERSKSGSGGGKINPS